MDEVGAQEWATRFDQQAAACDELGSPLYGRLLRLLGADIRSEGTTWAVLSSRAGLRFGQAAPLRMLGTAHRLALTGEDPQWAANLPSCGGTPPADDAQLAREWQALLGRRATELAAGLDREVQTNEVGRSAGLALALASTRFTEARLVEIGCSAGLNLRLDRFDIEIGGVVLGNAGSPVEVRPEVVGEMRRRQMHLVLPRISERVGLDPHPLDVSSAEARTTLLSYVWPDQPRRLSRVRAAAELAARVPAELLRVGGGGLDTAGALAVVLEREGPTVVQHSIVWQYVPTDVRWEITAALETAGERATAESPLGWVRFEPDEWDRRRAAVWLRTWPHGGDRLVAHADYHGRWLEPV